MFAVSALFTLLAGCGEAQTYSGISAVTVHKQTAQGTSRTALEGAELDAVIDCLYTTQEVPLPENLDDLLGSIVIIEVRDNMGDRMFELYSQKHLKGNKGKYYRSECLYPIISDL